MDRLVARKDTAEANKPSAISDRIAKIHVLIAESVSNSASSAHLSLTIDRTDWDAPIDSRHGMTELAVLLKATAIAAGPTESDTHPATGADLTQLSTDNMSASEGLTLFELMEDATFQQSWVTMLHDGEASGSNHTEATPLRSLINIPQEMLDAILEAYIRTADIALDHYVLLDDQRQHSVVCSRPLSNAVTNSNSELRHALLSRLHATPNTQHLSVLYDTSHGYTDEQTWTQTPLSHTSRCTDLTVHLFIVPLPHPDTDIATDVLRILQPFAQLKNITLVATALNRADIPANPAD